MNHFYLENSMIIPFNKVACAFKLQGAPDNPLNVAIDISGNDPVFVSITKPEDIDEFLDNYRSWLNRQKRNW